MDKIAVFPGSFDPFTIGHESIVRRAFSLFDTIIVAIGKNTEKDGLFPLSLRMEWIQEVFHGDKQVKVDSYHGLTVDYCKKVNAAYLLRGLRTAADFEYERAIAQINKTLSKEIETVFLLSNPEYSSVTSSIVKEIMKHGGDAKPFLPNSNALKTFKIV